MSLGCTKGAKQGPNTWHSLQRGQNNDERQRTINTLFSVVRINMVPTTVALRRMISWVPTPIARRRLHVWWFRFRHTQIWVWAPCWPLKDFARGTTPWSTCLRKARKNVVSPTQEATPKHGSPYPQLEGPCQSMGVRIPNSRGHGKAWESISPTRGAMPKRGKERQKDERKNAVPAFAPERICRCTWAGVFLRMQDLHFATKDICVVSRLANLALESTLQQTTFV